VEVRGRFHDSGDLRTRTNQVQYVVQFLMNVFLRGNYAFSVFLLRHSCKNAFVLRDSNVVNTLSVQEIEFLGDTHVHCS